MSSSTFNFSDETCALTTCKQIIAQVNCISYIMQGTDACINIQFFDIDGHPLDISNFCSIQSLLFNELDCPISNFIFTGNQLEDNITILQYQENDRIYNKGLIQICLSSELTASILPGQLFIELLMATCETYDTDSTYHGITCLKVGVILESKILKHKT